MLTYSKKKNKNKHTNKTCSSAAVSFKVPFLAFTGDNACRVNNGGCSTLCLAIPGGRVCACADNQFLEENSTTCTSKLFKEFTGKYFKMSDTLMDLNISLTSFTKYQKYKEISS